MKPGGRQYPLRRGKLLVKAIASGLEPIECHRKLKKGARFKVLVHDTEALFDVIDQRRQNQAVIGAKDAARWKTAKRRDARPVVAAETNLHGMAAAKHDARWRAKTAGVKTERNRWYNSNECFRCGKQGHKHPVCPQSQQTKTEKGVHGQSHGNTCKHQKQEKSTSGLAQHTWCTAIGTVPASTTLKAGASWDKTGSKAVVTGTEPAAPAVFKQKDDEYVNIRVPRDKVAPVDTERSEMIRHRVSSSAGPNPSAPVL